MTKKLTTLAGIGAGFLACSVLSGCENERSEFGKSYTVNEKPSGEIPQARKTLDGEIVDVQPVAIPIYVNGDGSKSYGYQIEAVFLRTEDGKRHKLICPIPDGISRGKAEVSFFPLEGEFLSSEKVVKDFAGSKYDSNIKFLISAEGIITPDGIRYSE